MKKTRSLRHTMLGWLLLSTTAALAESGSNSAQPVDSQLDPDGVPLSVTRVQQKQPTQAEIEAYRKQAEKEAQNKNWLLRTYQQQQQSKESGNTGFYSQVTSNKELAKLAGLPETSPNNNSLKTGATQSNGPTLRNDNSSQNSGKNPTANKLPRPLITPLSSAATMTPYSAPPPLAATSAFGGSMYPASSNAPWKSPDRSVLDSPGAVSAIREPSAEISSADLTLDMLPGESVDQARAHQDTFKAELSLPMDVEQLHQQQQAKRALPVGAKVATDKPVDDKPQQQTKPQDDPSAPTPVSQVPQINPVRAPIGNPFDFNHR